MAQRKPEQLLRDDWKKWVTPITQDLDWIECPSSSGIPDCNLCIDGTEIWVELKVTKMPARATTALNLRHFTTEQRNWLHKRGSAGSPSFLLLRVVADYGNDHILVHGSRVHELDGASHATSTQIAVMRWVGSNPDVKILKSTLVYKKPK